MTGEAGNLDGSALGTHEVGESGISAHTRPASVYSHGAQACPSNLTGYLRRLIDETDRLLQSAATQGKPGFEGVRKRLREQVAQMREQLDLMDACGSDLGGPSARLVAPSAPDPLQSATRPAASPRAPQRG